MNIANLDWIIIIVCLCITSFIGFIVSKKSSESSTQFFLYLEEVCHGGCWDFLWWLLLFQPDTPNLVTDIVRNNGVAGNWVWWVFTYRTTYRICLCQTWRKSGVQTDIEFYELSIQESGSTIFKRVSSALFRSTFNVLAMGGISLAAIKIGQVMLGLTAFETIGIASLVTVVFSTIGGFRGVVYTDFLLFFLANGRGCWCCFLFGKYARGRRGASFNQSP